LKRARRLRQVSPMMNVAPPGDGHADRLSGGVDRPRGSGRRRWRHQEDVDGLQCVFCGCFDFTLLVGRQEGRSACKNLRKNRKNPRVFSTRGLQEIWRNPE